MLQYILAGTGMPLGTETKNFRYFRVTFAECIFSPKVYGLPPEGVTSVLGFSGTTVVLIRQFGHGKD